MRFFFTFLFLAVFAAGFAQKSYAQASVFDSVIVTPYASAFFPWCGGPRPSVVSIRYQAKSGVVFADSNLFSLEISNARGEFDNPKFPSRIVGTTKSTIAKGTIQGIRVSATVNFNPPGLLGTPQAKFSVRFRSTHPASISDTLVHISGLNYFSCPPGATSLYASPMHPAKPFYFRGDQVSFTIYRDPTTLTLQPGDFIRIQLSDTNGALRGAPGARILDSVAANFAGDSMVLNFTIPNSIVNAFRYRVRATLSSDPNIISSASTDDFAVVGFPVGISTRSQGGLQVWPVPSQSTLRWALPDGEVVLSATLVSVSGVQFPLGTQCKEGNISQLPRGSYILQIVGRSRTFTSQIVKE